MESVSQQVEDADHHTLGLLQETLPMLISGTAASLDPAQTGQPVPPSDLPHKKGSEDPGGAAGG